MNKTTNIYRYIILFGIPLFIMGLMTLLVKSSIFRDNPNMLSLGVTFDLLLVLPILYFFIVRKTNIPRTTVVPVLILGIVVATAIIPSENQFYLNLVKRWGVPIVELTVLSFALCNLRKSIQKFQNNRKNAYDFYSTLKTTCYDIFPKGIVMLIVTEIAVFYYGFIYWRKRTLQQNEFSYHKDSGTITLLIAVIFIIAIETIVFHIVLAKWSVTAAWILTILSTYTAIQILGFLKSMQKRPISIEQNKLFLRYGFMNESTINMAEIDSIELASKIIEIKDETRSLSILGELESHNIIIRLNKENTMNGLYGLKRKFKVLVLYVDDKVEFVKQIKNALQ